MCSNEKFAYLEFLKKNLIDYDKRDKKRLRIVSNLNQNDMETAIQSYVKAYKKEEDRN